MLHCRIKAFDERNELKFIMSARLLYLAFLHGKENRYGRHWHHIHTALMRKAPHHTGGLLDSVWFAGDRGGGGGPVSLNLSFSK
jgi:hypothetical protein